MKRTQLRRDHITQSTQKEVRAPRARLLSALSVMMSLFTGSEVRAQAGDERPPELCLSRTGAALVYVEERLELQERYGSWTLYWRASRPEGFGHEERLALVTAQERLELLKHTHDALDLTSLTPSAIKLTPAQPSVEGGLVSCPSPSLNTSTPPTGIQSALSLYVDERSAELSPLLQHPLLSAKLNAEGLTLPLWLTLSLGDVERAANPKLAEMIAPVLSLQGRLMSLPPAYDQLLTPQERGQLLVKTDRPARLFIDHVPYGEPPLTPLPVSVGQHTLTLYPLTPPFGPFQYKGVEVEQGKLTRLSLSLR